MGKLSNSLVAEMRDRYRAGGVTYDELANEHRVTKQAIASALRGRTYTHLESAPIADVQLERCLECGQYKREAFEHVCRRVTHCKHGHLFDRANTYLDKDGWKHCKRCHRESGHNPLRRARVANLPAELIDRNRVLEAAHGICGICKTPVDPAKWHLDHIVPVSKGGSHTYDNVQPAHPACNLSKKDLGMAELSAKNRDISIVEICQIVWAAGQRQPRLNIAKEFQLGKGRLARLLARTRQVFTETDGDIAAATMEICGTH